MHDGLLFVVDRDNDALVVMDQTSLEVLRTIPVGSRPEQVAVGPDGTAWVTLRHGRGIARIAAGADTPTARIDLGTEPFGVALSPSGARVYVSLSGVDQIVTLDAATGEELGRAATSRRPRGIVASPDGGTLFVVHERDRAVELDVDEAGLVSAASPVSRGLRVGNPWHFNKSLAGFAMEPEGGGAPSQAPMPFVDGGAFPARALAGAWNPAASSAEVAHNVVSPGTMFDVIDEAFRELEGGDEPDEQADGGYGGGAMIDFGVQFRPVEPSITRLNGAERTHDAPVLAGSADVPQLQRLDQPVDLRHHPLASLMFMVGEGTDNVIVFHSGVQDSVLSPLAEIAVGQGPRAIAFSADGTLAYVVNSHGFTVSEIDLQPLLDLVGGPAPSRALDLTHTRMASFGVDPAPAQITRGRRVFLNARNSHMSADGQFACATCHLEGTEDGLVWFITNGPRQTPALAGRLADTAPFNWNGSEDELQSNMDQTVSRMGGEGLTSQERDDLEQFLLNGLQAPPNPFVEVDGDLTPVQQLGREIFESAEAGCSGCHSGAAFTNGGSHDVGTASNEELEIHDILTKELGMDLPEPGVLNTPTLRGLHYTAPYLHDGSAQTLMEVLERTADTMGRTSHLSADEREALVAYLLTL